MTSSEGVFLVNIIVLQWWYWLTCRRFIFMNLLTTTAASVTTNGQHQRRGWRVMIITIIMMILSCWCLNAEIIGCTETARHFVFFKLEIKWSKQLANITHAYFALNVHIELEHFYCNLRDS